MSVNGQILEDITRSSNTFNVDGLSVNLKGTFNYAETDVTDESGKVITAAGTLVEDPEAVTFTSTSDADKVVDAIRSMVEDYNAMVTEIKNAYSTLPAQKSSGAYYEPLTDKDMEGMSESAIAAYEEKAKQGLLFGDSDLSALYSRLLNAVSMTGSDGAALKAAGITTAYSNGLTTLTLDETTLRATLETDPDKVRDIFTKSTERCFHQWLDAGVEDTPGSVRKDYGRQGNPGGEGRFPAGQQHALFQYNSDAAGCAGSANSEVAGQNVRPD